MPRWVAWRGSGLQTDTIPALADWSLLSLSLVIGLIAASFVRRLSMFGKSIGLQMGDQR